MAKVRVYELAMELNMDSKELVEKLRAAGIKVKNYMSTLDSEAMEKAHRQAIGGSAVINERRKVKPEVSESLIGHQIDHFLTYYNELSVEQQELSRADFEGHPQLIRGVAGSGKSVVLSICVARFVDRKLKEMDGQWGAGRLPRVAVVCFNRSFVPFLRKKIEIAFRSHTDQPVPDGIVEVVHLNGLLFSMSDSPLNLKVGPLRYQPFSEEIDPNPSPAIAKKYISQLELLARSKDKVYDSILFDAIYVDEGQDFHPEEFSLLMMLLRPHPKTHQICPKTDLETD